MTDFKVAYSNGKIVEYKGDSFYTIKDAGVLVINSEGQLLTFSPTGWLHINESDPKSAYEGSDSV